MEARKIYSQAEIRDLKEELAGYSDFDIYCTSGGFDPLHVGHLRCIQQTARMCRGLAGRTKPGIFAVIVNGDGFLYRKKGYAFMPHNERMEIVAGLEGVDYVVGWDDGTQTVTGAIDVIRPDCFTKGGDRDSAKNVPEFDLCKTVGCKVMFNVGGGKIRSSSELAKVAAHAEGIIKPI